MTARATARAADPRPGELLRRVSLLEIAARRNLAGLTTGDWPTAVPGQGLLYRESRKYVPGEPARSIDWNVTARQGEPYVKVHAEERRRDVLVVLDVSPSMHTGFQAKTKLEFGVELAATLALAAIEAGDRAGWVIFADRVLDQGRTRGGRAQLFRLLAALLAHTGPWQRPVAESDPRAAFHAIGARRRGRYAVFMISDFIDHDLGEDLKYVGTRHDVSLLHVYDPFEVTRGPVVFRGVSPERDPRTAHLAAGAAGSLEEVAGFLRREARRHKIAGASFATTLPVAEALDRFLHFKRRRATR